MNMKKILYIVALALAFVSCSDKVYEEINTDPTKADSINPASQLTYAELQTSALNDLRPLAELYELRDMNICYNFSLTDISPLYGLTQLDRLWIGCLTPIPPEQVALMQQAAPECTINTEDLDPTREQWRWDGEYDNGMLKPSAGYEQLRITMKYDTAPYSYSYIRNDPLYSPHGQGDNTTPPEWFTTQVPIPVDYTVY